MSLVALKTKKAGSSSGIQAVSAMIRHSTDQVVKHVKKRYTGKGAPVNIAKDIGTIMSLLNVEEKHVENLITSTTVNSTSSVVLLIGTMAQGTTSSTREGDSIKLSRFDLNLQFAYSSGTAATSFAQDQIFNWYLVRYLKTPSTGGTAAFAVTDFLNLDANSNVTPLSLPNADLNEDFKIIANGQTRVQLFIVPATSSLQVEMMQVSHPVNFHQTYTGAASTTLVDNAVFLVVTGLQSSNIGGVSSFSGGIRTWYIDN